MFKYLIESNYQHYDDFDFSNVCICDTKERAEELVKEFNQNKERFKNTEGLNIYLEKDFFKDSLFSDFENFYEIGGDTIVVFINAKEFGRYQQVLEACNIYSEKSNYFNYILYGKNIDELTKRYCNHEEANFRIKEIEFIS